MSNLIDIQNQIEKLQKQANDIKAKEFHKTVQEIVATMQAFGITGKDLQSATTGVGKSKIKGYKGKASATRASTKVRKPGTPATVAAKYRGPNGESWSGRGLMPKWLVALVSQGKNKEEFAVPK